MRPQQPMIFIQNAVLWEQPTYWPDARASAAALDVTAVESFGLAIVKLLYIY